MKLRDFALLFLVCVVWGLNFVVTKWVVAGGATGGFPGLPPLFAVTLRFALTAAVLAPFLRPIPRDLPAVVLVGLVFGAAHFGLMHLGFLTSAPSAGAIAMQLSVPFTTVLSVLLLREQVGPLRVFGIALAVAGVVVIAFDPHHVAVSAGLLFIVAGAAFGAWGAILVKQLEPMGALRLQAWVVLVSTAPLALSSALTESGQIEAVASGGWRLAAALAFVVGLVTIFAHTSYMWLLRRYDASFLSPLTLMGPVWGVVFGVTLAGDPVSAQFFLGATMTLLGVGVVAVRTGRGSASAPARPAGAAGPS